jgi:hypothetical protein
MLATRGWGGAWDPKTVFSLKSKTLPTSKNPKTAPCPAELLSVRVVGTVSFGGFEVSFKLRSNGWSEEALGGVRKQWME